MGLVERPNYLIKGIPIEASRWGAAAKPGVYAVDSSHSHGEESDQSDGDATAIGQADADMDLEEDPFDEEHVPVSPPDKEIKAPRVHIAEHTPSPKRPRSSSGIKKKQEFYEDYLEARPVIASNPSSASP